MYTTSDKLLLVPFLFILLGSIVLTVKSRCIQLRAIPLMMQMLLQSFRQRSTSSKDTILPYKALFTSMSTTIGIGNMVGPIIAMGVGGVGSLAGFVLATFFGAASTFTEVTLALHYRKLMPKENFLGGPMPYLHIGMHSLWAKVYAYAGTILLVAWSSNQSNTLSMLLEPYGISKYFTGALLACAFLLILTGGIQRIGNFNAKVVPLMFVLYGSSALWIIFSHAEQIIPSIICVWQSLWDAVMLPSVAVGVTLQQALRYGLARAFQSNEAGIGTATFAHSMAEVQNPVHQGILAMVSVYSNGILCLLSAMMVLVTSAWQEKGATFDVHMLMHVISQHFPTVGPALLLFCAFLFAFGTILGNGYNGRQCFLYVTKGRGVLVYYLFAALVIFFGCLADVQFVWTIVDFFVIPVATLNTIAIVYLSFKHRHLFKMV